MLPPTPVLKKPISISLGTKKSATSKSTSLSTRPAVSTLPSTSSSSSPFKRPNPIAGSKKRSHSSLADSDSEEEEDGNSQTSRATLVSGFDHAAGGAIHIDGPKEAKKALVITGPKNRDWREESRRRRGRDGNGQSAQDGGQSLLPHEVAAEAARNARVVVDGEGDVLNNGPQAFGLTFTTKPKDESRDGDVVMTEADSEGKSVSHSMTAADRKEEEISRPKTVEELALEALTGINKSQRSDLVLPTVAGKDTPFTSRIAGNGINEDDAFRTDVESRPDSSTLDDYAAIPVEEFGAALLRGMGWKEGDVVGKRKDQISKARVVERRPALLGIGAKEVPGGAEELGAWGKALMGKGKKSGAGRKTQEVYTPVVLRDSVTGEMVTEEELKERQEGAKKGEQDWRDRRDRNLERDRERKGGDDNERGYDKDNEQRKRRREEYSEKDYKSRSSKRERSRSPSRRTAEGHRDRKDREHRGSARDRDNDRERYESSSSSRQSRGDGHLRNEHRDRERDGNEERDRDWLRNRDRERDRDRNRDKDKDRHRESHGRNGDSSSRGLKSDNGKRRREQYGVAH